MTIRSAATGRHASRKRRGGGGYGRIWTASPGTAPARSYSSWPLAIPTVGVMPARAIAPRIAAFLPLSGAPGTSVTITGVAFDDTSTVTDVRFHGAPATFTVHSTLQLTATVPAAASTRTITVSDSEGTSTSLVPFSITAPAPLSLVVASFLPLTGPTGTPVTIAGTGFTGATSVKFNGTSAAFAAATEAEGAELGWSLGVADRPPNDGRSAMSRTTPAFDTEQQPSVRGMEENMDHDGGASTMTLQAPDPRVDTVMLGEAMPEPETISVAVVDDHPVVLRGLEALIEAEPDMTVVATAHDGEEAVRRVIATQPDVVVMDIRMPTCDGVEATEQILAAHPEIRVILLSGELGPSVVTALKAGAYGYLSKDTADRDLVAGIRNAVDGRPVIASSVLGHVLDALRHTQDPSPLTPRERAILACVAQGNTNEQISRELGYSISTVKAQLAAIYEKLGVSDRASSLAVCFRRGWIT